MKVQLNKRGDGTWQADILLPDGSDHHAIGRSMGDALMELGFYLNSIRKRSDLETLARVLVEHHPRNQDKGATHD